MSDSMLLDGINHVAVLTADTDRFVAFYRDVFGAVVDGQDVLPFGTLTFVNIGGGRELNVFEVKDNTEAERQVPAFERGRLDHIGFQANSLDAFNEARRRLMAKGATDGFVTDFGSAYSCFFRDPDGLECEVVVPSPNPGPSNGPGTPAAGYEVGIP
jgi:catechol 2,3-dioxygenase-like lactoylglutathione lyase family enzyme